MSSIFIRFLLRGLRQWGLEVGVVWNPERRILVPGKAQPFRGPELAGSQ